MQDANGFITMDAETGANLSRDHNNMLSEVTIDSTIHIINSRDANGILRRRVIDSSGVMTIIDRIGDSEFRNGAISTVHHPNGYITFDWSVPEELRLTGTQLHTITEEGISITNDRVLQSGTDEENYGQEAVNLIKGFEVSSGAEYLADIDTFTIDGLNYFYVIKDHLGSVRVIFTDANLDGTPEVLDVKNYYPFGGEWESNTDNNDGRYRHLRLGGERQTSFGLDYDMHAFRDYDPWTGRWHGPDMLSDWAPSLSPYRYAFNNPVNYVDPLGLFESKSEARKYARDNNIRTGIFGSSKIRQQSNGSYAIENSKAHTSIANDSEFGVQTGLLVESTKTYFTPTMSAYEPNLAEKIKSHSFVSSILFDIVDNAWVVTQSLNPLDNNIQSLTGKFLRPIDQQMALVNTVSTAGPMLRGSKMVTSIVPNSAILPRLNTAQFSQMFKGSFIPKLEPALRGKLNRLFNFSTSQGNNRLNNGSAVLNAAQAGSAVIPESN